MLWGVAFGNIVRGVPLDTGHHYTGSFLDLLNPYALLGGLTTLTLFVTHGAVLVALKAEGPIRVDARRIAGTAGIAAGASSLAFLVWTQILRGDAATAVVAGIAALALVAALGANRSGREGWAFTGTAVAIVAATATLFLALYPNVLPSVPDSANSLTGSRTPRPRRTP